MKNLEELETDFQPLFYTVPLRCVLISLLLFSSLGQAQVEEKLFVVSGSLENHGLDESSGLQAGNDGYWFTFNDSGGPLIYATDAEGNDHGGLTLLKAKNKDWEDITRVPDAHGGLLVFGDTGDNQQKRKSIKLYFVRQPKPDADGKFRGSTGSEHEAKLRFPDGPRDIEAMAFDAASGDILLLSKRDKPPRLYAISAADALLNKESTLEFRGEILPLRAPSAVDLLSSPKRGQWISQPTGMDISPDGLTAAVITYRSLYIYARQEGESWLQAFQREPLEFLGPPGLHDEAVGFSPDGSYLLVTTEGRPAPVYRLEAAAWKTRMP